MKKIVMFVVLLLVSSVAVADNWVFIGRNNNGDRFYFDPSSVSRNNSDVIAEIMINPEVPINLGNGLARSSISASWFNCLAPVVQSASVAHYDQQNGTGRVLVLYNEPTKMTQYGPGSVNSAIQQTLCK